ncbi:MAG: Asp23/Gls24 family envelope stress response protein [Eubacteriales bacterium]
MLKIENEQGLIALDDNAVANIVSITAGNCFGITGMTAKNVSEEFWNLFKRDSHDKGISVKCTGNEITVDLHIMVVYGINIPAITESIVHKITYSLEESTGFKVKKVCVFVDAINTK